MHEGWMVCKTLELKYKCFKLVQYHNGGFVEEFHQHVPARRISSDKAGYFLRARVCRFYGRTGMNAERMLSNFLNKRSKDPQAGDDFIWHTVSPESGVIRHYCGTNTKAWVDEVISPSKFRCASSQMVGT